MSLDWTALKPHVPVDPGATEYVEQTGSASEEIVQWLLAGRSPILLGGPAGVGKSTELARAAELLQPHRVACLVRIDRFENMRRLGADQLRWRIASLVAQFATETLRLQLVGGLNETLQVTPSDYSPARFYLQEVLAQVGRLSGRRVTLLLDGLEKVPNGAGALELFDALGALPEDVELITTIPWHAAFGPLSETVIRAGERLVAARPIDVKAAHDWRWFFETLILRRLGLSPEALDPDRVAGTSAADLAARTVVWHRRHMVESAVTASGGLPRTFLQLMADAATYARLRRQSEWPEMVDFNDACKDQVDSFARLLLPGDTQAAQAAVGTDGRELALDQKVRLMAHGILLERVRDHARVLELHPLANLAIGRGGRRA